MRYWVLFGTPNTAPRVVHRTHHGVTQQKANAWRINWCVSQRHDAEAHLLYSPLILSWSLGTINMMLVTSSSHCK